MRDKLLFGTIGLLVGVVVMQWTMPLGRAEVVTSPVGNIVAQIANTIVVGSDGGYWNVDVNTGAWQKVEQLPISLSDIHFIESAFSFVDKDGNLWENSHGWVNHGQPPIGPVGTTPATLGKVKAQYQPKGGKP